ncbi:MAG: SH3 beta-barrel fold-containing protein [Rikenellaceae bacterium]
MRNNFRTEVFKRAHSLAQSTGEAFAACLAKAWNIYRLARKMAAEVAKFAYTKVDGSLRIARGTLRNVAHLIKDGGREANPSTLRYYDVEAEAFRSFRVENLITVY